MLPVVAQLSPCLRHARMIRSGVAVERVLIGGAQQNRPRNATFYYWLFIAGFFTFIQHEAAHWVAGTALGYDMQARLNAVSATSAVLPLHKVIIDAAGPFITIVQALVAFAVVMRYRTNTAFVFLYMAAFMRVLATAISAFHPNDEARLSIYWGMGTWTLPIVASLGLLLLVWRASRHLRLTWKEQLLCYLVASASVSLVVGADRFAF
jgi:hypothetical protein